MKKFIPLSLIAPFALAACSMPATTPQEAGTAQETQLTTAPVAGKNCIGLVEIEISQSSFTLDPIEHWKNSANASTMTIGFLPSEYNRLQEGEEISSDFRGGSFWLNGGKISSRDISVNKKLGFACE